ncbi:hypothetical protein ABW02_15420 [Niallia circulans]|uniref:Uncharacterized protein n=1 Tax=Niallia circulans TaxID=1397 RepID=A0A0J1IHY6_NIACI|nr:hypothetical protein A499_23942 [Niallia nealsonii AAU1]KLV25552.1 hypothetical protein ABW02_15420 [Niallia circulans]SLL35132.1 Uncharacterised protein [Mycobacteroides abscessus subsp. abscessus]
MSIRKRLFQLLLVDFVYLLIYFIYIISPIYPGYYLLGIINIVCLIIGLVLFLMYLKNAITIKKFKSVDIFLTIGYLISIFIMSYTFIVWLLFSPDWFNG